MNNDVIVLIDTGLDKEIYRNRIVGGIHFYIEDEMICCDKIIMMIMAMELRAQMLLLEYIRMLVFLL